MLPLINTQPAEKQHLNPEGQLEVMDVWDTIQGEGPLAGMPAVFCRLSGCNLRCDRCDTTYTGPGRESVGVQELYERIEAASPRKTKLVVLTGGEPFRQNIGPICQRLLSHGVQVQIETNGTLSVADFPFSAPGLTLVCSPKAGKVNETILNYCRHYKYVLEAGHVDPGDGLPTSVLGNGVRPSRVPVDWWFPPTIWVQPMDSGDSVANEMNVNAAVESCMKFGYRYSHQVHKEINVK